jgi:hypothetical protein
MLIENGKRYPALESAGYASKSYQSPLCPLPPLLRRFRERPRCGLPWLDGLAGLPLCEPLPANDGVADSVSMTGAM